MVLTPASGLGDYLSKAGLAGRERNGLGPAREHHGVYPDLRVLEATWRLCRERAEVSIPAMNRELVERTTHIQALDAIVASMPDDVRPLWQQHAAEIDGSATARRTLANLGRILRNKPFMSSENRFQDEELIRSRLGTESVLIDLPTGTIGPFGDAIRRFAVPGWWNVVAADEAPTIHVENKAVQIVINDKKLNYSSLGLKRAGD